jgi:hypothetical protein
MGLGDVDQLEISRDFEQHMLIPISDMKYG